MFNFGKKEKPLIKCSEALYQAYSGKLGKCVPELAKSAPIIVGTSYVTKSDMDRFFNEYPQNVIEIKRRIPDTATAVQIAFMNEERRNRFWAEYPQNVQEVQQKYPRASVKNIIWVLASNKSEKEKEKQLKKLNRI